MGTDYYLIDPANKRVLDLGGNRAIWKIAQETSWGQPADERGLYGSYRFRASAYAYTLLTLSVPNPEWVLRVFSFFRTEGPFYVLAIQGGEEVSWMYPFGESPDFNQPWMERPDWTIERIEP